MPPHDADSRPKSASLFLALSSDCSEGKLFPDLRPDTAMQTGFLVQWVDTKQIKLYNYALIEGSWITAINR